MMKGQPSLLRLMIRRSRQIVLLTLVVSIPLVCLIFVIKQPNYEAYSLLRFEPSAPNLFAASKLHDVIGGSAVPYLQTQVQLIKSDSVLESALANPLVSILPSVKDSDDPKTELLRKLSVEFVPDAYIIRVALELKNPTEAAVIVNAVVESYRIQNERYVLSANKRLRESLEREDNSLQSKIESVQNKLREVVQTGKVRLPGANDVPDQAMNTDTLLFTILNHDLASYQARKDIVTNNLAQLAFESNQESFRIILVDPASVPKTPSNGNRLKYMAAAPGFVCSVILGVFLVLEIIAGRSARAAKSSSARLRAEASDLLEGDYFPFRR
jgi:uncharacterized protein involved in exopolysaccharide biosynthesis